MTGSVAAKSHNKLSRRKKAKATNTLHKAFSTVIKEIDNDAFLRNHLFLQKVAKDKLVVGAYIIVKTEDARFDIYKKNMQNLAYKDIFIFDAAMAIVEALNTGADRRIKVILEAEEEYANYYTEMKIFENAFNNAEKEGLDNGGVFAVRYDIAKYKAKLALEKLQGFRIGGK